MPNKLTSEDALALLTGQRIDGAPDQMVLADNGPVVVRRIVWSRCDACGYREQGLYSTRRPHDNKYGNWCGWCYQESVERAIVFEQQLLIEG